MKQESKKVPVEALKATPLSHVITYPKLRQREVLIDTHFTSQASISLFFFFFFFCCCCWWLGFVCFFNSPNKSPKLNCVVLCCVVLERRKEHKHAHGKERGDRTVEKERGKKRSKGEDGGVWCAPSGMDH